MNRVLRLFKTRRLMVPLAATILIVFVVFGGLMIYKKLKYSSGDVLQAIPSSAILVGEGVGVLEYGKMLARNSWWGTAFGQGMAADPLSHMVSELDSLSGIEAEELADLFSDQPFAMALVPRKQEGPALVYAIRLGEKLSEHRLLESLGKVWKNFQPKQLLEISYHEAELSDGVKIFVLVRDGLFIFSADRETFELSWYTLESGNHIGKDQEYVETRSKLAKSQNNVPHFLMSHEGLFTWFRRFTGPRFRELSSVIVDAGSWSALELTDGEDVLHLQGFTQVPERSIPFFEALLHGGRVLKDPAPLLPKSTFFYDQLAVEGFSSFYREVIEGYHFKARKDTLRVAVAPEWVDTLAMVLKESDLRSITFAMSSIYDSSGQAGCLLYLEAGRSETAMRGLEGLSDTNRRLIYQDHVIHKIQLNRLLPALLGKRYQMFEEAWFTLHRGNIIVAQTKELLMSVLNDISLGKTLSSLEGYREGESRLQGALSRRYFMNGKEANQYLRQQIVPERAGQYDRFIASLPGQLFIGFIREEGVLLTDLILVPGFVENQDQRYREVVLDDAPVQDPLLLKDHRTGELKVIVADRSGNLYSLTQRGGPEWKMASREVPASVLMVIDLYRNGREQCLFLGQSMIHLVQADGQYVKGYPVRLPTNFESGLAVFDYEGNGNYRLLYRDVNGKLVNVDIAGNPVAGWTSPAVAPSDRPVTWMKINGLDFLCVTDASGALSALDRRGKERFRLVDMRVSDRSDLVLTTLLGQSVITFVSAEGHLYQVDGSGVAVRHEVLQFAPTSRLLKTGTPSVNLGFAVIEPKRVSLFDQNLKVLVNAEINELEWKRVQTVRGSQIFAAAGLDRDGVPYLIQTKTGKVKQLSPLGFDHVLVWYDQVLRNHVVFYSKGALTRIGSMSDTENK